MDFFTKQGIIYAMLIIPTFFALTMIWQGMIRVTQREEDGPFIMGFGVFLLILIGVAFVFFIL